MIESSTTLIECFGELDAALLSESKPGVTVTLDTSKSKAGILPFLINVGTCTMAGDR